MFYFFIDRRSDIQTKTISNWTLFTNEKQFDNIIYASDYSYKDCFSNDTWNTQTEYSTCSVTPRLIARANWHTAMLSISIIIATPAIILLIFHHGHQVQKFALIRNLIIAIVARNILVLISKRVIIMEEMTNTDQTIMSRNEWACKMLTFFEKLATNLVFACMLLEGIFLHQLLTNVFASRGQSIRAMFVYYIVAFGKEQCFRFFSSKF